VWVVVAIVVSISTIPVILILAITTFIIISILSTTTLILFFFFVSLFTFSTPSVNSIFPPPPSPPTHTPHINKPPQARTRARIS
jgi:hypothetical protein